MRVSWLATEKTERRGVGEVREKKETHIGSYNPRKTFENANAVYV